MDLIHHPCYYLIILGLPLSYFYRWVSKVLLHKGVLESVSGVGGISMLLTTLRLVIVVGFLCSCLIGGFIYIYRVKHNKPVTARSHESIYLVVVVASLYSVVHQSDILEKSAPASCQRRG